MEFKCDSWHYILDINSNILPFVAQWVIIMKISRFDIGLLLDLFYLTILIGVVHMPVGFAIVGVVIISYLRDIKHELRELQPTKQSKGRCKSSNCDKVENHDGLHESTS